jgi:hypothetical protein
MDVPDAFQIVLDLARQNVIDARDDPDEHERQINAIDIVKDIAVNQFGDE